MVAGLLRNFGVLLLALGIVACSTPHEPAPVENVYRGPTFHNYERASLSGDIYEVQRGDTLYTIAFRANQDLRDIAQINNLSAPYTILVGQRLRLSPQVERTAATNNRTNNSITNDTNVIRESVAPSQSREYGNTSEADKSEVKQAPASAVPRPVVSRPVVSRPEAEPQRTTENNDVRWQWPHSGALARRFSNYEVGGKGIEFNGSRGDPVVAAAAGRVVYVGSALRGYGRLIILKHNDDFITAYGHNDNLLVQEQEWVAAGQQIATMGSSGRDDVRLRFELRFRGISVNPENHLPRRR